MIRVKKMFANFFGEQKTKEKILNELLDYKESLEAICEYHERNNGRLISKNMRKEIEELNKKIEQISN